MITVTLEFESIEQAQMALERIKPTTAPKAEKPAVSKPEKVEAPKPVASVPAPAEIAPAPAIAESPSEVTYADVSAAVLAKMKVDKAAVMAAAAKFGVKNAKELKQEQWADFIKEIA